MKSENKYTMIVHRARHELKLTLSEYAVGDYVHRMSSAPDYPFCQESQDEIAKNLYMGRSSVYLALAKLKEKGLAIDNEDGLWRSTQEWFERVELLRPKSGQKRPKSGQNNPNIGQPTIYKKENNNESMQKQPPAANELSTFSLEETLKKWEDGGVRRMDILAWYFKNAKFIARSKKELDNLVGRHIKAATKLEVYTDKELVSAWEKAKKLSEKLDFDPTLETVLKQLTQ